MRPLLILSSLVLLLAGAAPAGAVEHVLVRWKKTGRCEIVTAVPRWGDHWLQLGTYSSRGEAERALAVHRKAKSCPPDRSARSMETPPPRAKTAPTFRRGDQTGRY